MNDVRLSERLRKSILLYSILSGLLIATAVAVVSLVPMYETLRDQRREKLLSVLHVRATAMEIYLWEAREVARQIASRTTIRDNLSRMDADARSAAEAAIRIRESLLDAANSSPSIAAIYCYDAGGTPVTHVGPPLPSSAQHWLQKSSLTTGPVLPVQAQGEHLLLYRVEVQDRYDNRLGTLAIEFELDVLKLQMARLPDAGPYEDTFIGYADGDDVSVFFEVLGRNAMDAVDRPGPRVAEALQRAAADRAGLLEWDTTLAEPELLAYRPIEGTDWGIIIRQTERTLLREVNEQLVSVAVVVLLLIAGLGVGMYLLLRPLAGKLVLHSRELEDRVSAQTADLTAERQRLLDLTETLQQQKKQLEAANEDLEAFSRTVAHDLRSPLVAIQGYSDLLLTTEYIQNDPDSVRMLQRVAIKSRLMADQIKALLHYARAGKTSPNRRPLDLSKIAESVGRDLQHEHSQRHVELVVQPDLQVNADEPLLYTVMENLLGNAWKYTSRTTNPWIEVGAKTENNERVFYVRDNGTGFDMMFAERLFEPFQRLHTDAEFAGTGIGLSTVRRIVRQHGGRIWAEGRLGKGATFFFTLPDSA